MYDGLASGVDVYTYVGGNPVSLVDPEGLAPSLTAMKEALRRVYSEVGGRLPKGSSGKWGSPQRGDSKKGYRYDKEGHPNATDPGEKGPHINWWDYSKGSRKSGQGRKGAVPVKEGGFADPAVLTWLIPWWATPSEVACGELDCDHNGIPDFAEREEDECTAP